MTDPENADPSPPDAPADADGRQPRQRSRLTVALVAAGLAVVLVALSLVGARILGWWSSEGEPEAGPTSPPAPSEPPSPFAGTPAEDFAEGADGIVLPEAEPVGDFTAEEVADALEQVRRALIAARLDHTMLIDHDPNEFLTLLAPDERATVETAFDSREFITFATQLAEDTSLVAVPPRVDTSMSFETIIDGGVQVIEIVTRSVWAYALTTVDAASDHRLVVVRDELIWRLRDDRWRESSQGLWLPVTASGVWGADCDLYADAMLRPADGDGRASSVDMDAIFSVNAPLESLSSC